jgi:hypothetical protein
LFGPPKFFNTGPENWGICPQTISNILQQFDTQLPDFKITISAVELYFDDCYDLLNKKIKIPISGFGLNVKSAGKGMFDRVTV